MAAVASYLNVKSVGGQWLLRIDDLDTPRVVAGSAEQIVTTLQAFGMYPDAIIWQSQRLPIYRQALAGLAQAGVLYACLCSRAQIVQRVGRSGCYDNYCRHQVVRSAQDVQDAINAGYALRLLAPSKGVVYQDGIQGQYRYDWGHVGDPLVFRADGIVGYHLACAVDDADFGLTEVVRGQDLLASTPAQRLIQQTLGLSSPSYAHYPIVLSCEGVKLSKASRAPAVDSTRPTMALHQVLSLLGQTPPSALFVASLDDLWAWAMMQWQIARIPNVSIVKLG